MCCSLVTGYLTMANTSDFAKMMSVTGAVFEAPLEEIPVGTIVSLKTSNTNSPMNMVGAITRQLDCSNDNEWQWINGQGASIEWFDEAKGHGNRITGPTTQLVLPFGMRSVPGMKFMSRGRMR